MFNGSPYPMVVGTTCPYVFYVVPNTPGNDDGILQAWVDGNQVIDLQDMKYQNTGTPNIAGISFTIFFGGDSIEWAPLKLCGVLRYYVSDRRSTRLANRHSLSK